ncbi:hypothetical protein [Symmachiella dynata]|uniref:hypothetical protein n=1 Tax=Symmachiella dynata TaxID=2527995 RepID=UPI0030EB9B7B
MTTRASNKLVLAAMLTCGLIVGCGSGAAEGPPRADVRGVVTLDGQPLPKGVILFVPLEGTPGPKTSIAIADGKFSTDDSTGPVVGKHRIEIKSTDDGGYARDDETAIDRLQESRTRRIDVVRVPAAFNANSRLTETVSEEGANEFEFPLTTSKRRRR